MSHAWEVTDEDVLIVLARHGQTDKISEAVHAVEAEVGRIEDAALAYDLMTDQVAGASNEIEDILLEEGVLTGEKQFFPPDPCIDDDLADWDDAGDWDDPTTWE